MVWLLYSLHHLTKALEDVVSDVEADATDVKAGAQKADAATVKEDAEAAIEEAQKTEADMDAKLEEAEAASQKAQEDYQAAADAVDAASAKLAALIANKTAAESDIEKAKTALSDAQEKADVMKAAVDEANEALNEELLSVIVKDNKELKEEHSTLSQDEANEKTQALGDKIIEYLFKKSGKEFKAENLKAYDFANDPNFEYVKSYMWNENTFEWDPQMEQVAKNSADGYGEVGSTYTTLDENGKPVVVYYAYTFSGTDISVTQITLSAKPNEEDKPESKTIYVNKADDTNKLMEKPESGNGVVVVDTLVGDGFMKAVIDEANIDHTKDNDLSSDDYIYTEVKGTEKSGGYTIDGELIKETVKATYEKKIVDTYDAKDAKNLQDAFAKYTKLYLKDTNIIKDKVWNHNETRYEYIDKNGKKVILDVKDCMLVDGKLVLAAGTEKGVEPEKVELEKKYVFYKATAFEKTDVEKPQSQVKAKDSTEQLKDDDFTAFSEQLAKLAAADEYANDTLQAALDLLKEAQEAVDAIKADIDAIDASVAENEETLAELKEELETAEANRDSALEAYEAAKENATVAKDALANAVKNLSRFGSGAGGNFGNGGNNGGSNGGSSNGGNYGGYVEPNTNTQMIDNNLMNIADAAVPMAGDAQAVAGNAGAGNRRGNDGANQDNAGQIIEDDATPLAVEDEETTKKTKQDVEDDQTVEIEETETPEAAEAQKMPWWILILIAIGLGGIVTAYTANKKKAKAEVESK